MHPVAASPPCPAQTGPQMASCWALLAQSRVAQTLIIVPSPQMQISRFGPVAGGGSTQRPLTQICPSAQHTPPQHVRTQQSADCLHFSPTRRQRRSARRSAAGQADHAAGDARAEQPQGLPT